MAKRPRKGYAERRLEQKRRLATVSDMSEMEQRKWLASRLTPPLWPALVKPNGFLDETREAQACWTYYLWARNTYEAWLADFRLEGHGDFSDMPLQPNYRQLFKSVAVLYGVEPDAVAKCWDMVDMQCAADQLPPMPKGDRYRHDATIELATRDDDAAPEGPGARVADGDTVDVPGPPLHVAGEGGDAVQPGRGGADQREGGRIHLGQDIAAARRARDGDE